MTKIYYKKSIYSAFILSFVLFAFQSNVFAKDIKSETIEVAGNCEMCQKRIVSAASVKGVKSVTWSPKTQILSIKFDNDIITLDEIEQRIAKAGHDTPNHKADDSTYDGLHGCCQYDRKE